MSNPPHFERHFSGGEKVRDIIIGMSDGLTVPFALAAGLTSAITASKLVVTAGLAEIAAGSIAMGLGGYLAARSDADHYAAEKRREEEEIVEKPHAERAEVAAVFRHYGLSDEQIQPILASFEKNETAWVDFMMRFELGLERPEPGRSRRAALTIGGAYAVGGIVPLAPYFFFADARAALPWSAACALAALFAFGWAKGKATTGNSWVSAGHTTLVGAVAAAAAYGLARIVG
jgi:VIT1/CCC1 family predicted Fe2+/Mn2+ transporter